MTIHTKSPSLPDYRNAKLIPTPQYGCEGLPALRSEVASMDETVDRLAGEINEIEGKLRALSKEPLSPERGREKTRLGKENENKRNERYKLFLEVIDKREELRELESRCIKQA